MHIEDSFPSTLTASFCGHVSVEFPTTAPKPHQRLKYTTGINAYQRVSDEDRQAYIPSPQCQTSGEGPGRRKAALPVHVKPIKKKSLLIGVKDIRKEVKGVSGGVKPPQRGPVTHIKSKLKVAARRTNKLQSLKGPHRDVRVMRDLLINTCKYSASDIVALIDDNHPRHPELQPTRNNTLCLERRT